MLQIGIAGSTQHTRTCAEALLKDGNFAISWILTPSPKPIGRKQVLTKNPLHLFAEEHGVPVISVEQKIDQQVEAQIRQVSSSLQQPLDFVMVVDFGYLIPEWLLKLPRIAPINIHPSSLPRWRGSSPGQFVLLYGEEKSAVTVMKMDEGLDTGPIIHQEFFVVEPGWTQTEYYDESFKLISAIFPDKLIALAQGTLTAIPQPVDSPTPIARRFTKEDGFVDWDELQAALAGSDALQPQRSSSLLQEVQQTLKNWPQTVYQASNALSPWPGLWTMVETERGQKRMKILKTEMVQLADKLGKEKGARKLRLAEVQLEGEKPQMLNRSSDLSILKHIF